MAESPVSGLGHNRFGFFFGAGGYALFEPTDEAPSAQDKLTGELLGRRVATIARRLRGSNPT